MTTTVAKMGQNSGGVSLFYYLKITGLPYYFFSVVNPTDTKYGTAAWTLPTYASYPGYSAVQGMAIPADTMSQSFADMIGGIGNAEKARITLADFNANDANGSYQFLARMFACGIQATGSQMTLARTLAPADTQAVFVNAPLTLPSPPGGAIPTFPVIHVGGEAFGCAWTTAVGGITTVTVSGQRNLYPCSAVFPPVPLHTVRSNPDGTIDQTTAQRATFSPYSMIGRSAALYVGNMDPSGVPCTEAECQMRLLGRISSIALGQDGRYELQLDSLLANAGAQQVCSGLYQGTIAPDQIVVQSGANAFLWGVRAGAGVTSGPARASSVVAITAGTYTLGALIAAVNLAMSTEAIINYFGVPGVNPYLCIRMVNGMRTCVFQNSEDIGFHGGPSTFFLRNQSGTSAGFLQCLGFDSLTGRQTEYEAAPHSGALPWDITLSYFNYVNDCVTFGGNTYQCIKAGGVASVGEQPGVVTTSWLLIPNNGTDAIPDAIIANNPAPGVFIPYSSYVGGGLGGTTTFNITDSTPHWFTDQGDGGGQAFVRFGNGDLVRLDPATSGSSVTIGKYADLSLYPTAAATKTGTTATTAYYSVPQGQEATVEQVVLAPGDHSQEVGPGVLLGRFVASTGAGIGSGNLDCYPPGVGLGFGAALDVNSFAQYSGIDVMRAAIVDSATTLSDLFAPIAREYGWFLVWDPLQSLYTLKSLQSPVAAASVAALTESNRATVNDRTVQTQDQSSLRSSWTLKWGYDRYSDSWLAPDLTEVDTYVVSQFGIAIKGETIQDKTILQSNGSGALPILTGLMLGRGYLYRIPFLKCKRSISKVGSLLCPGDVCAFVDNTVVNPFTGVMGITAADAIYAILTQVDFNYSTGVGTVTALLNRQDPASAFGAIAPCAALDYAATGHGYDTATGTVTCLNHYTAAGGAFYDGIDFHVGDTVVIASRDGDGSSSSPAPFLVTSTITAVAVDGHTVTVASGLGVTPTGIELIMYLRHYTVATTTRQKSLAFQGDKATMLIEATVQTNRWA
jgi:hypothetical protein